MNKSLIRFYNDNHIRRGENAAKEDILIGFTWKNKGKQILYI